MDGDRRDTAEFMSNGSITCHDYSKEGLHEIWSAALNNLEMQVSSLALFGEVNGVWQYPAPTGLTYSLY